jgi:cytochrome c biogenesis protein CcmG, thiol:disulfide interchange protein DsbE
MMRAIRAALTLATLLALPTLAAAVQPGSPAPAFVLPGAKSEVSLADYRGKFVYVDFWASWCVPCRKSFPWMNQLQQKFGDQLAVVAVNVDAQRADAERFLASVPASFTVAYDPAGKTPGAYGIKGMPSSVLVGPDGKVVFEHAGFREDTAAKLEARIAGAIRHQGAGKP